MSILDVVLRQVELETKVQALQEEIDILYRVLWVLADRTEDGSVSVTRRELEEAPSLPRLQVWGSPLDHTITVRRIK